MNREMRRLQAREERRQKKADASGKGGPARGRPPSRRPQPAQKSDRNFFQRVAHFLHEVRVELRRVSWPTRQQMVAFTTVTLITTTILTAYTFGLDIGFKNAVLALLELGS